MSAPSLVEIAAELYAMPPGTFIAARNERAKSAEDAAIAAEIRALRKPSVAAWVVNLFARERTDRLAEVLRLADELREAQAELDAQALAQLGRQRRALTNQLADEAAKLATARGERVTAATREAVQQTLTAAFFDPRAADAVASGRLVRDIEPSGDTTIDPETFIGGGAAADRSRPEPPADELRARRERRDAERAVHDSEQALARAERALASTRKDRQEAAARADELADRIRDLETELTRVRERASATQQDVEALGEKEAQIEKEVGAARRAADAARAKLEDLRRP